MLALPLIPFLLVQSASGTDPAARQEPCEVTEHVVLISIDGFRPEFYLDPEMPAPTLRRMRDEGTWADGSQTVFPSVTYPSHTTLVTGVTPAVHGIYYNTPQTLAGAADQQYFWADSIRVPALWDVVRAQGGSSVGFWWPATIGADMDVTLPVPPLPDPGESRLSLLRKVVHPSGFIERMEREVTGPLTDEAFQNGSLSKERHLWAMARQVILEEKPNLLLYHVLATDAFQHEHGRDHPEVREAVVVADSAVATLVSTYEEAGLLDRTTFVITGDHGFADYSHGMAPNVWLDAAGFLKPDELGIPRARFIAGGGYALLLLRDVGDEEVLATVRAAMDRLPPAERERFDVVDPEQVAAWGADPRTSFALSARPGSRFEGRATGAFVEPVSTPGGAHGHRPDLPELRTGFIAWGAGIEPGKLDPIHALDITPFVARLLDLPLDGRWSRAPWIERVVCGRQAPLN